MSRVLFIKGQSRDPYFNLASEEYLLRHREESFIYVWINSPAVIVGVNQNAAEEVDLGYAERNGIKVVRRQTGGGAVYHDENNICYTIIAEYDGGRDNYRRFTEGIIGYLGTLGVKAEFSGRNDVCVGGQKISGNAQCVYKNRIMHHGTILFDTDMSALERVLRPHKFKVESKGIKSVRSRVTNISDHLSVPMTANKFFEGLSAYLGQGAEEYIFTEEDLTAIDELVRNKYSTFAWNIGSSPRASFLGEEKFPFGLVQAHFDVENGRLRNVNISGDFFSLEEISGLNRALNGVLYDRGEILAALSGVEKYIVGADEQAILSLFFR